MPVVPYLLNLDERGFVRLTISGAWPAIEELRKVRKALDEYGDKGVLADMRGVTEAFPYHAEIRKATEVARGSVLSRRRRRAIIVGSDIQYGIARQFQALLPGEVEIFRDENEAVSWLLPG